MLNPSDTSFPSISQQKGPSESEIWKRLAVEEEMDEVTSATINSDDHFSEMKYLLYGLDLEEKR